MSGRSLLTTALVVLIVSLLTGFLAGYLIMGQSEGRSSQETLPPTDLTPPAEDVLVQVPSVVGLGLGDALNVLSTAELRGEVSGGLSGGQTAGKVSSQSPQAGEWIVRGSPVTITVSAEQPAARWVVCLDPGHADTPYHIDDDTGLNTQDWANEPETGIVFDIACRAREILESRGVEVVMTKGSVYEKVDLKRRAVIANEAGAALILHIHTDPAIGVPTTFYPGGDAAHNWKANSASGRKAVIDPAVQEGSERLAKVFHEAMMASLRGMLGPVQGALSVENRGATGTGNDGPIFSYDIWSRVPTFTLENNQQFADTHRQEIARAIADGVMACLR